MSAERECGVCWYGYDPAIGDDVWQVPAGTAFDALPPEWRCPRCDAPQERFLPVPTAAVDPRVGLLEAAYRRIHHTKMAGLPIANPRLSVEAVGFAPFSGGLFGALVTPWSINAVFFPPPGPPAPAMGHARALPSGDCTFFPQEIQGVGPLELASLFSPALEFEDQAAAVATAAEAVRLLRSPQAPPPTASPPARSRRELFALLGARREP